MKSDPRSVDAPSRDISEDGALPHILGESDKGRAVSILNGLYTRELGEILTVAIGDSLSGSNSRACGTSSDVGFIPWLRTIDF